jgi:hypothetical protein
MHAKTACSLLVLFGLLMMAGSATARVKPGKWKPFYKDPRYAHYQHQRYDLNKNTQVRLDRTLDPKTGNLRYYSRMVSGKTPDQRGFTNLTKVEVHKGRRELRHRSSWRGSKNEQRFEVRFKGRWLKIPQSFFGYLITKN